MGTPRTTWRRIVDAVFNAIENVSTIKGRNQSAAAGDDVTISAGDATAGNNAGGNLNNQGGAGSGAGSGGTSRVVGGPGGATGPGGPAELTGGLGGTASGSGAPALVTGGAALAAGANGGDVIIDGGPGIPGGVNGTVRLGQNAGAGISDAVEMGRASAPLVPTRVIGRQEYPRQAMALAAGANNNVDTTTSSGTYYEITGPAAAFSVTGFTGGTNGRLMIVVNTTAQDMTLANESAGSVAANRIQTQTGADVVLAGNASGIFIYSTSASRWKLIAVMEPAPVGSILTWGNDSVAASVDARTLAPGYDRSIAAVVGSLAGGGNEGQYRAPRAGTMRNLRARHNTNNGNGNTVNYRLFVNGVASALQVNLATAAIGDATDAVNVVAVAAGDLIDMVATKAVALGSGVLDTMVAAEFRSS